MKELAGIKLTKKETPFANFIIVFRCGEELTQDICSGDEEECNQILSEIAEGKGIEVNYDFMQTPVRVYPNWAIKVTVNDEYRIILTDELRKSIRTFTPEVNFPEQKHIGSNLYQPSLE